MLDKTADKTTVKPADKKEPVVVKKYANRRLYNTETSTYVTLDDLAAMVKAERDFVVYDAKSGDDLTHSVLTQIIVEQEARMDNGQTMLPIPFLRQLIRFYGDSVGKMVPSYLQVSIDTLSRDQSRIREQFTNAFNPQSALEAYHEQARKNLSMFEQAMKMFSPFSGVPGAPGMPGAVGQGSSSSAAPNGAGNGALVMPGHAVAIKNGAMPVAVAQIHGASAHGAETVATAPADAGEGPHPSSAEQLSEMRQQLAAMQSMIDKLAKDRG